MSRSVVTHRRRRRRVLQEVHDDLNTYTDSVNSCELVSSLSVSGGVSSDQSVEGEQECVPELTLETWKTLSGNYEVICQLISIQDQSIECPIMQEPTSLCCIDNLSTSWTIKKNGNENSTANTAKLPCSHTFYAPALAVHFLSTDMRCPVCRAGSPERMDLGCVPENLRQAYQAKLSLIHERSIQTEIATIDTLHIIDVLSQLQLELRINDALDNGSCLSLTQTRMVYDNRQVHAIQNSIISNDDQLTTNFPVHRSFQRLTRSIIGRHFLTNPCSIVVFAITHPLLPFSFSHDPVPASTVWTQHFSQNTDAETYIPLYCSSIAGADSVGCVRFQFCSATNTTSITVDINIQIIINISSYVTDVFDTIRESIHQHLEQVNAYTSAFPALTQQTMHA
jgi:hypothetical protein